MFSISRVGVCILLLGCVIQEGHSGPWDAIASFKKGLIAGILKSHALKFLHGDTGNVDHSGSITANIQYNGQSDSHNLRSTNRNNRGNVRVSGYLDISGKGYIRSSSSNGNMEHKGSLSGNIRYDSRKTSSPPAVKRIYYIHPDRKILYSQGSSLLRANAYRSRYGMPYGSRNVNVMVTNSGSGTGAIINVNHGNTATTTTTTTTTEMPITDYVYESPAVNEVDYPDIDYTVQDTDVTSNYVNTDFGSSTSSPVSYDTFSDYDTFDTANDSTSFDYTNDYTDTTGTGDTFSATGTADFSASGDLLSNGGFEASGSADFSASGATNTGIDYDTTDDSNFSTDYVSGDVAGNTYEMDTQGHIDVRSLSNPTSKKYDEFMITNMDAMQKLSNIARQHGTNFPLTIRLRTRQRTGTPTLDSSSHGSISYQGGHNPVDGLGSTILEIQRAPLLYKYSDVIESPDAHTTSNRNINAGGTGSFSLSASGTGFDDFSASGNAEFSASSNSDNGFNADGSASFSVSGSTYDNDNTFGIDDSTDYFSTTDSPSTTDYNNYNSNDYDSFNTTDTTSDFSDYNPNGFSDDFSTTNTYDTANGFNVESSGQFSASGSAGNDNAFNSDGAYDFSATGSDTDNGGFNAGGSADFFASGTGGNDNGFQADGSGSFSASSSGSLWNNGRSVSAVSGKAIANNLRPQNSIQARLANMTMDQRMKLAVAMRRRLFEQQKLRKSSASVTRSTATKRTQLQPTPPNIRSSNNRAITIAKANNNQVSNIERSAISFLANFAEAHRQSRVTKNAAPVSRARAISNVSNRGRSASNPRYRRHFSNSPRSAAFSRAAGNNQGRSAFNAGNGRRSNNNRRSFPSRGHSRVSSLDRKENSDIQRALLRIRYRDSRTSSFRTSHG